MKVLVAGAGIIGRAVAWRLAQRGAQVTIVDPDRSAAAAMVAAGMLAPVTEARYGEEALLGLNLESARRWPMFAAELAKEVGVDPGFVACGTLAVARDADDRAELDRLAVYLGEFGLDAERLSGRAIRRREPALAASVRGGLWVPGDHQVNPRRVLDVLALAAEKRGVEEIPAGVVAVGPDAVGLDNRRELSADAVVVCAGWASGGLLLGLPVRPVKGQVLRFGPTARSVMPSHVLRGLDVYLVTRSDGEVVVGATTEDVGPDTTVTVGAVRRLLDEAWRLVPGFDEAPLVEISAGLRPDTPDGAPILDTTAAGVHVATGHNRNGVLFGSGHRRCRRRRGVRFGLAVRGVTVPARSLREQSVIAVRVNGESVELSDGSSLAGLVESHVCQTRGVAIAVNEEVIPRSAWAATSLAEGDRIEILTARQGG